MLINNIEFACKRQTTSGTVDLVKLTRANNLLDELEGELTFKVQGDLDSSKRPILNVIICGKMHALCQTCLSKMEIPVQHTGEVAIFDNEADLEEALFGEEAAYSDGILTDPEFDLLNFIEDEIIMLIPVAPKHDSCDPVSYKDESNNPFGAIKQLIN